MNLRTALWLRIALVNLLIVALLGTVMRYKIAFTFPYLNQKYLQHAHSHFALIGWITHALFVLMAEVLLRDNPLASARRYNRLIGANLICAYGMLIAFAAQGYRPVSITLSVFSIAVSYVYAFFFIRDMRALHTPYKKWFTAALAFNVLSSFGTFVLGYMMGTHNYNSNIHLGALYYYLHFQYNGFFMFACLGLLFARLHMEIVDKSDRLFWMFFVACVPAYFLSILWANLPMWLFMLMVAAAIVQFIGWLQFLIGIRSGLPTIRKNSRMLFVVFVVVSLAVTAKFLLQLGSTVPALSKLAFGFRPIVIAYLHLVLLAIISVFVIAYMYRFGLLARSRMASAGIGLFVVAVYLNEVVLGTQGIASFSYTVIPCVNEMLFGVAVFIFVTIVMMLWSQRRKRVEG